MRNPRQDVKGARNLEQETKVRQDNKRAIEPVIGACTEAQKLSSCAFFLAVF